MPADRELNDRLPFHRRCSCSLAFAWILKTDNVSTTSGDHFVCFMSSEPRRGRAEVFLVFVWNPVVFRLHSEQADHLLPAMKVGIVPT